MLPCERDCRAKTKKVDNKKYTGAFENIELRVLYLRKCAQYFCCCLSRAKSAQKQLVHLNPSVFRVYRRQSSNLVTSDTLQVHRRVSILPSN